LASNPASSLAGGALGRSPGSSAVIVASSSSHQAHHAHIPPGGWAGSLYHLAVWALFLMIRGRWRIGLAFCRLRPILAGDYNE
jgi:hypothetical protein